MGGLGDIATALFAVIGTLAALRQRDRTRRPQRVDVAMLDAMVAVLDVVPTSGRWVCRSGHLAGDPARLPRRRRLVHAPGRCGRTSGPTWPRAIGRPDWADDPRFETPQGGSTTSSRTCGRPSSPGRRRAKREACDALNAAGLVAGPVATDVDVVADPHLAGRHMLVEHPRTDGVDQPVLIPGLPMKFAEVAEGPRPACRGWVSTPTMC